MKGAAFDAVGTRRRSRAAWIAAALAHLALVAVLLSWRAHVVDPAHERVVETTLLTLGPPAPLVRPSRTTPPAGRPMTASRRSTPPRERESIPVPATTTPVIAAPLPASAASAPRPEQRLDLTLSRARIRALEDPRTASLAERIAPPLATASPLARIAGDDSAFAERSLPDGSIQTHVHGTCVVQQRSLANQLDPIGHAHDAALATSCK